MNDPLDSAIPVGSGPGSPVPPAGTPPPPAPPPAGASPVRFTPSGSDKIWTILSHVSWYIGVPFLLPLVVYLAMKGDSEYVADNAREALNFHISVFLYGLCLLPLVWLLIGIPLLVVMTVIVLILSIVAAVKAANGIVYRYPLTIRLVK